MIDTNTQFEAGGRVCISGQWHDIDAATAAYDKICAEIGGIFIPAETLRSVIQAYEPPVKVVEPYEWISANELILLGNVSDLSNALTEMHGDPRTRTFAGEPAAQYGLEPKSDVLVWDASSPLSPPSEKPRWEECEYRHLNEGDVWRMQPPAPKEVQG